MVFPRPAGPCLCGHSSSSSSSSSRCRPSVAFLKSQPHQHFRRNIPASGNANFELHYSSFRAMVFPRPAGPCLCGQSSSSSSNNNNNNNSNSNSNSNMGKKHEYVQVDIFLLPFLETFHLTCHSAWGHVRPFGFLCLLRILPDSLVVWIQVPHVGHAWT